MTYRIAPHGAADFLERYRTKEEVAEWRKRDPIGLLEARLLEAGVDRRATLDEIRAEAKPIVDEAVKFAEESPEPELAELYTDVYAERDVRRTPQGRRSAGDVAVRSRYPTADAPSPKATPGEPCQS